MIGDEVWWQAHVEGALAANSVGFGDFTLGGPERSADDGIAPGAQNSKIFNRKTLHTHTVRLLL